MEAFGRSLIAEMLDFFSFLLAFFLSFRYYNIASNLIEDQFSIPHGLSLVFGFMAVWFLSETIFYITTRVALPDKPKLKIVGEEFLAIIPALFRAVIFLSLVLVLIATFPIQPAVKKAVVDSKIGSLLLKNAYQLEAPVKNVFGGVSNDTLTFLTIKPRTDERVNLGFKTQDFKIDETTETEMIDLVNSERRKNGLNTLKFDSNLRFIGREHSKDMFERGYFSHYSPEGKDVADRAEKLDIDYLVIGENLAYAPNLAVAHRGLMNSPGHRANILSPEFNKIGIGVIDGGVYGMMFTQVFSD